MDLEVSKLYRKQNFASYINSSIPLCIDGGEFPVKQFMSHFGEIISSVGKNMGPYSTMQPNVPVIHVPPPLAHQPHGSNFIYSEAPFVVRQHQPQTKIFYRTQQPHDNRFHQSNAAGPKSHGQKSTSNFDKSYFRASQPLPLVENTDLPTSSIFQTKRYQNNDTPPNRSSGKKSNNRVTAAGTFFDTDTSEEWSPFSQSLTYRKHHLNSENQQYQQQERISFYPDTNPEYFQPHHNYETPTVVTTNRPPYRFISTAESKYQSNVAPSPLLYRTETVAPQSPTSPSPKLDDDDLPPSHKRVPYIRRKYRTKKPILPKQPPQQQSNLMTDDVKPVVEYTNESSDTKQIYVRNAITPRTTDAYVSTTIPAENESAAIFITPVNPSNTETRGLNGNFEAAEAVTPVPERTSTTKRKHNRIFRRKFVQNIGASGIMGESCESSCLSNIVSRDYDPVCGSDDKSYANLGRLRCTKICGEHRKYNKKKMKNEKSILPG